MDPLDLFGLLAVSAMLLFYALEDRAQDMFWASLELACWRLPSQRQFWRRVPPPGHHPHLSATARKNLCLRGKSPFYCPPLYASDQVLGIGRGMGKWRASSIG